MRRNLIASVLSTVFIFAGFACGAANSELYAVMPSEAESSSASASAPRGPGSVSARPGLSGLHAIAEPEEVPEPAEIEELSGPVGILGLIGGPADSGAVYGSLGGVLGAGSAQGLGGLGLSGIGTGSGTGLGGIGTGTGVIGSSRGNPPQVRAGKETVVGKLPPEVIKRIVRQNFGRFRLCYENGLRTNPRLEGRVTVRFAIARDGNVASATNSGSTLPNPSVVTCVVNSFRRLSFPPPDGGGLVVVTYPISFSPGDSAAATATATQRPPPPPPGRP